MDESTTGQQQQPQQQAIFTDSQNKEILKGFIGITTFMVLLAMLFCIIVGAKENRGELWLLIINLAISSFVTLTLCYWYRQGELASDKSWFLILVASVLIFQTITTDIYVFNPYEPMTPTTSPPPTLQPLTTLNSSTIKPPIF